MYPVNPNLNMPKRNIFTVRQENYDQIVENIRSILEVPIKCGFTLEKFEKVPTRYNSYNLISTIKENLVIKLSKNNNIIDLSMQIPKLIDGQWIVINNKRKIPRYQLYDIPVLTMWDENEIRILTNIGRVSIEWKKNKKKKIDFNIQLSIFSKKIPFAVVICAFYGAEYVYEKFLKDNDNDDLLSLESPSPYQLLLIDLFECCDIDMQQEQYIEIIGEYFSKTNATAKGNDYLFTVAYLFEIDIMTKQFIEEDNVIDCFVNVLEKNINYDNVDFQNKRIRCFEYMILKHFITNIYKLCLTSRNANKPKYNVSKTKILADCNVSDIIQYDYCINPISQLAQLSQITMTGPDGFAKESIPTKLKDLHKSMFGKVCPVDTPDRENCGVVQNLNPTVKFDDKFKFIDEGYKKAIVSLSVSMVPFLEHNDQTRLQMSASQARQSILLNEFHIPYICSGVEKQFTRYTDFVEKAEDDGEILFKNKNIIIVGYISGKIKIYKIGVKHIVSSNMSYIRCDYNIGDKFDKDSIITYSTFCKDEIITIGQNFKVAFMSYYGFNHEDGIVISDRLVKDDCLTSCHYMDMSFTISPSKVLMDLYEDSDVYMPLHPIGTKLKKGDIYAKLKEMYLFGSIKNDSCAVFEDSNDKIVQQDLLIEDVVLYANDWYHDIKEYDQWVENTIQHQIDNSNKIIQVIADNTDLDDAKQLIADYKLDLLHNVGKYKKKDELLKGVYVEMHGVYNAKINIGDKLANRHGNKGVITLIVPHKKMPQLPDGSHVDMCINPMGVISRMNTGQMFEVSLSNSLMDLKKNMIGMIRDNKNQDDIKKYLLDFIYMVDQTPEKYIISYFKQNLPNIITEQFVNDLYLIQPQFDSIKKADLDKIMKYTNTDYRVQIYDPYAKEYIENKICTGYLYIMKLVHMAEPKLTYRSIGITSRKTMQPTAGKSNNGGQRCGEMESGCFVSIDAPKNHVECYTVKSDCVDLKNNFLKNQIGNEYQDIEEVPDTETETLKLLKANLSIIDISIGGDFDE